MMMEVPQYIEASYEESQCLMKIAQAEAGNQGVDGMALVMKVILNRVESNLYPDNIYDVIAQKGQFESYFNGNYEKSMPSDECVEAYEEILSGAFADDTIIAFEISGNRTLDKYFFYAFTYKGHDFYTLY